MAIKIVYSAIARNDLVQIYDFISTGSLFYARKEIAHIQAAIKKLRHNNFIGKKFEDLNNELIRELVYKNYRIIYELIPDKELHIITIHHQARSLSKNPAFNDED